MKLHEAIARNLADHDVECLFGLIGDANLYLADSYARLPGRSFIAAAHEAAATQMALGYAQATGRVGVVTVTHGAALSNTLTALIEGVKSSVPLVLLAGDTPAGDLEHLQNIPQKELVTAAGAGFVPLRGGDSYAEDVGSAFRRAAVERRPVVLDMPADLQWQEVEYRLVRHRLPACRTVVPESEDLDNAVGIIAAARSPLVLAGRGAIAPAAREALLRLAARIDAPLLTTLRARDLFRSREHNLGIFGTLSTPEGVEAITASDCVVAFGASLNVFTTGKGALLKGKRIVHVDVAPAAIGRHVEPDAGVVGDAELTADLFVDWLDRADIAGSGFRGGPLRDRLSRIPGETRTPRNRAGTVDLPTALRRLNAAIPDDRLVTTDAGRFLRHAWAAFPVPDPRSFIFAVGIGSIGLGLGHAIGAAAASPGRPSVLVAGDGGLMLSGLTELHTAVKNRLDLIVIVCNDGSYGAEHIQFVDKGMDPGLSLFDWPDFAAVARALGADAVTVSSDAEIALAVEAIGAREKPLLIDLKLDPDAIPSMRR